MSDKNTKDFFSNLKLEQEDYQILIDHIKSGDTSLIQSRILETMIVDDAWVQVIENLFFSIEQIVKKPKSSIIDEREIANVEKAKRIDGETVRHLSENTQYIRSFNRETGDVQPSKVLIKEMQEDFFIYENRFIVALIDRLCSFIEQRYSVIKEQIDTYDTTNLKMHSKFNTLKGDVTYDLDIKVRNEPTNKILLQKNYELLNKIEIIRKRIMILQASEFYKKISKLKPVTPPIMKTNIINMHTDYNNCYKLYVYISSYTMVGFSVEVEEKKLPVDTDYYDDLTMLISIGLKAMIENNAIREPKYRQIKFRKRGVKRYRELRRIQYEPSFKNIKDVRTDDIINQYYFEKIKQLFQDKDDLKKSDFVKEEIFQASFSQIFKSINNINNEMYQEIMSETLKKPPTRHLSRLQLAKFTFQRQEMLCGRLALLSRLKIQELARALKRENTQKIRLEKLRFAYETELAKVSKKKPKKTKPAVSPLELAQRRLNVALERAEKDHSGRLAKEIARQEAVIEKETQKLENLRLARERKREIMEIAKEIIDQREDREE